MIGMFPQNATDIVHCAARILLAFARLAIEVEVGHKEPSSREHPFGTLMVLPLAGAPARTDSPRRDEGR